MAIRQFQPGPAAKSIGRISQQHRRSTGYFLAGFLAGFLAAGFGVNLLILTWRS